MPIEMCRVNGLTITRLKTAGTIDLVSDVFIMTVISTWH